MEPTTLLIAGLVAVALVAIVVAIRRGQALGRIRAVLGEKSGGDVMGPERLIGRLREDLEAGQQALDAERADAAALLEAISTGLIRLDMSLRIISASTAAHLVLDRAPGTLVGRSVMEAFLDPEVEEMARAALDGAPGTLEVSPAGPDGRHLVLRATRALDGGVWLQVDDVSELRRLQRIRAEFIDNLSHELRTPLTTVSLLSETLSRDADAAGDAIPARMRERIGKIEVETGHLVQMVNELLDLSRIEGGGTIQVVDGIDLGALAARSAERLRLFAERQGVRLDVNAGTDLPPIRGDEARLGQVVINLVHNAVKFSPDGGDVVVSTVQVDEEVVVSVEDHGVGIPRAAQDRVFERFYKVDRSRLRAEAGGGTGLGLAIARHVVEQHGGRIWVESTDGKGSTFRFAIPITPGPGPV